MTYGDYLGRVLCSGELSDHFASATMVVKMTTEIKLLPKDNTMATSSAPTAKQNFSIDALLNLRSERKAEHTSSRVPPLTAEHGVTEDSTMTVPLSSNKTMLDLPLAFSNLPFSSAYLSLPPATFMEPIYRTDAANSRDNSPTVSQQHQQQQQQAALLQAASYPWSALAALHTSTVQAAAAAAFSRSYLPSLLPSHSHMENFSEWGKLL